MLLTNDMTAAVLGGLSLLLVFGSDSAFPYLGLTLGSASRANLTLRR